MKNFKFLCLSWQYWSDIRALPSVALLLCVYVCVCVYIYIYIFFFVLFEVTLICTVSVCASCCYRVASPVVTERLPTVTFFLACKYFYRQVFLEI